jgi:hypothetical protein
MFAALAAGYLAKSGYLQDARLIELELRVENLLPPSSEIREAVELFCLDCRTARMSPKELPILGDRLIERVQYFSRPVPPGSDRADLNG